MGRFTEDMGRLRDEIEAERMARQSLIADIRQDVADAARSFMRDLKTGVETLQAGFRESHADMAAAGRADRDADMARLAIHVADLQLQTVSLVREFAEERTAGRQAWRGATARPTTPSPARTQARPVRKH